MVCSPHGEFERVRHHAKHRGSSFCSKVRAKNVKALQLVAKVPGDPFGALRSRK
jgi:hypothetical protein